MVMQETIAALSLDASQEIPANALQGDCPLLSQFSILAGQIAQSYAV